MRPTEEQWQIITSKKRKIVVVAAAGTGKTSTLVQYAKANPNRRMLYIAYNRAICQEAETKFPKNVECRTSHQLAHAAFAKRYRHKFAENLRLSDIVEHLGTDNWRQARDVATTLETFMYSGDKTIVIGHTPQDDNPSSLSPPEQRYKAELVTHATELWTRMVSEEDPFRITHDGLLKVYQLSDPDLSVFYSVILFDEAQDANPVTTAFIEAQDCISIFVGDRHQQIYRYRGADNALDSVHMDSATKLYLTNSFRFGPEIAMVANAILSLKGETVQVVGRGKPGMVCMLAPGDIAHLTVLQRTVLGAITTAITLASRDKRIYWVGGIERYGIADVADVYRLAYGGAVRSRHIRAFGSFEAYKTRAKQTGDREMLRITRLIQMPAIGELLKRLKQQTVDRESEADITLTTVHRSKGLEWDNVAIADDFPDVFQLEGDLRDDELNLLYVAVTRAQHLLVVNSLIEAIMRTELRSRQNEPSLAQ